MTSDESTGVGPLAAVVAAEMNRMLSNRYTTTRRGGDHRDYADTDPARPFWVGVGFGEAVLTSSAGRPIITMTFVVADVPDRVFGYRIDVNAAVERWNARIGIVEAGDKPLLFAAELVWYIVAHIGMAHLVELPTDPDGVAWLTEGDELFGRLRADGPSASVTRR